MFRKNVASQFIHFQGVDATTGGIKSGVTWTVRRCIDGTFAAATGTVTEDGTTGWYKFAMSQADTNGNNIGFNFTGTGAVPQTVNIVTTDLNPYDAVRAGLTALPNAAAEAVGGLYTRGTGAGQIAQDANGNVRVNLDTIKTQTVTCAAGVTVLASVGTAATSTAQTGDAFARLGAPAGASVSADIAAVKTVVDAVKVKTDFLPSVAAGAAGGVFIAGANAATTVNITGNITGNLSGSVGSVTGAVGSVTGAVGSVTGNVGGNVVGSVGSVTAAVTVGTNNDKTGYALTAGERTSVADALLGRNIAGGSSAGRLVSEALAFLRNKWEVSAGTLTVYATDDVTPLFTAALTRTAVDAVTAFDPA